MVGPAIDIRNFRGRVAEFSAGFLNQSIFSTGILSTVNGNSESYRISGKDSATPPQDLHNNTSDLRGILPRQSMAERLRRANNLLPSRISNQHEQNIGHDVPKSFNIPTILAQYPLKGEGRVSSPQNRLVENISTPNGGQQSSFPSPFPRQLPFMQSGNNKTNTDQNMHGFYPGNTNDGISSNWAFESVDNPVLPDFLGFEFPVEEGQDISSLLNGAAWDGSTFQD